MCLVEVDAGRGSALQPCVHDRRSPTAWWSTPSRRGARRPRTASSSSCSSTTRSTARCATRAASARCRTRRSRSGPASRRFVEEKRHFEKPIPISDLVLLDRERCILCDRCTRFAKRGRRRPADPLHGPNASVWSCSGHSPPRSHTGQSSGWLIEQELEHAVLDLLHRRRLRVHDHAVGDGRRAAGERGAADALDLDEAHAAHADRLHALVPAEARDVDAVLLRGLDQQLARLRLERRAVDGDRDGRLRRPARLGVGRRSP